MKKKVVVILAHQPHVIQPRVRGQVSKIVTPIVPIVYIVSEIIALIIFIIFIVVLVVLAIPTLIGLFHTVLIIFTHDLKGKALFIFDLKLPIVLRLVVLYISFL